MTSTLFTAISIERIGRNQERGVDTFEIRVSAWEDYIGSKWSLFSWHANLNISGPKSRILSASPGSGFSQKYFSSNINADGSVASNLGSTANDFVASNNPDHFLVALVTAEVSVDINSETPLIIWVTPLSKEQQSIKPAALDTITAAKGPNIIASPEGNRFSEVGDPFLRTTSPLSGEILKVEKVGSTEDNPINNTTVTLAVSPAAVTEDGANNLIYTFTRAGVITNALTVNYTIAGSADTSDYSGATPGTDKTITFAAGAATATLTIDPTADTTVEADETIALTLAPGTGYTVATTTPVIGTITNDDTTVTLAVSPAAVTEDGANNLIYTFTRAGVITNALTVNYTIAGSADAADYSGATPGTDKTITFAAGSATTTFTIDPTADTTVEADETIALTLAPGTGYTVATTTPVIGTITNDDTTVSLAVSPAAVTEDGANNLIYTFTRTGVTTNALTVNYTIAGSADTADYSGATPGTDKTITFAAGSATATLTIDPTADTSVEADETIALTLAPGTGYTVATTTPVIGTITNDDTTVTLAVSPAAVTEDGANNLIYTFTRTGVTTNTLTVKYTIAGSADTTDYSGATPGKGKTITFAAGSATATLTIDPTADTSVEADETIALTLAPGTGYTVATTTPVIGTITNDDIIGTTSVDILAGTVLSEFIDGKGGKDTLTGGYGHDVFGFGYTQSTIIAPDRITDFEFGSDKIALYSSAGSTFSTPVSFSRAANNSSAKTLTALATAVFSDSNGALSGNQALGANSAVLVTATNAAIAGTYLLINDSTAVLSTNNDLMVNITGFNGSLPAVGTISPIDLFFA